MDKPLLLLALGTALTACPLVPPRGGDLLACQGDEDCAPAGRCEDGTCKGERVDNPTDGGVRDAAQPVGDGGAGGCAAALFARTHRAELIVDPALVITAQTAVPILLDLSRVPGGHALLTETSNGGDDLIVTAADGTTRLPLEVVSHRPGEGIGELWWSGDLDNLAPTSFWIYFGAPDATRPARDDPFGSDAVWADGFRGVWHLEESSSEVANHYDDSSPDDNDGTGGDGDVNRLPTRDADPPFGRYAQHFDAALDEFIDTREDIPFDITGELTVSGWARFDSYDSGGTGTVALLSKRQVYRLGLTALGEPRGTLNSSEHVDGPAAVPLGEWHHLALAFDGAVQVVYLDGVEVDAATGVTMIDTNDSTVQLGSYGLNSAFMDGSLDELRLSGKARSPGFIALQHAMMRDNDSFWGAIPPAETCQ